MRRGAGEVAARAGERARQVLGEGERHPREVAREHLATDAVDQVPSTELEGGLRGVALAHALEHFEAGAPRDLGALERDLDGALQLAVVSQRIGQQ